MFQAVFGITKKDLLDYIRAGSRGDLLNKRCWFQGRNSKNGLTLSEELEADDRLEADKEGAGSSTQVTFAYLASLTPCIGSQPRCAHRSLPLTEPAAVHALSLPAALGRACHLQRCAGTVCHAPVRCRQVGSSSWVGTCLCWGLCITEVQLHLACNGRNLQLAGTCRCGAVRLLRKSALLPCLPVQAGSLRAHMPDLEIDSGTIPAPFGTDSTDLDADIVGEEVKQAKAILASRSFFRKVIELKG